MEKKPKRPRDISQLAAFIVDQSTNEDKPKEPEKPQKNLAAVELGRLGGLKTHLQNIPETEGVLCLV